MGGMVGPAGEMGPTGWIERAMCRFTMGTDDPASPADEQPSRQVTVGSFALSAPVTAGQWQAFATATGYRTVAEVEGSSFARCEASGDPVAGLDWWAVGQAEPDRAVVHVAWLDAWEYCRWSGTRLPTEAELASVLVDGTVACGERWLWCDDWYSADHFHSEQRVNPTGPTSGTHRVARAGGSRPTSRAAVLPDLSAANLGFAVVRPVRSAP